ncbi:MAG: helix-turn-helix domain-containing protein [Clostridia bacterium]|nr:helix-turn-helix domain-containing protein [Clostridia bacterium]MBP3800954.1 helix-turn-helix domain-containing protein [Clostridia bacterium]
MNEENQISYYAIIPATVRYSEELKPAEKLLYGEITALANKNGYCFAQNRYFAKLYHVSHETVSRWISHLQKLGFIQVEIVKNDKKEIVARNIYIIDLPYPQKNQYPYCQKDQEGIDKKVKYNNIKYNNIHYLFNLIINKSDEIPIDFYKLLNRLEFLFTPEIVEIMQDDKIEMVKYIIFILFDIYNSLFSYILPRVDRNNLVKLYLIAKSRSPDNLIPYYKRVIINQYIVKE